MTPAATATLDVAHPLADSDRLAWQATAAVHLLERFGDLLSIALDAVGRSDDTALTAALLERERVLVQLEPLLAPLAVAREAIAEGALTGAHTHAAIASILRPVDRALRHAQLLHVRLADEVAEREPRSGRRAPVALVR